MNTPTSIRNDLSGINVKNYDLKENVFVLQVNEYTRC